MTRHVSSFYFKEMIRPGKPKSAHRTLQDSLDGTQTGSEQLAIDSVDTESWYVYCRNRNRNRKSNQKSNRKPKRLYDALHLKITSVSNPRILLLCRAWQNLRQNYGKSGRLNDGSEAMLSSRVTQHTASRASPTYLLPGGFSFGPINVVQLTSRLLHTVLNTYWDLVTIITISKCKSLCNSFSTSCTR